MRKEDVDMFRERERRWRKLAEEGPLNDREACQAIADHYARLIALIEQQHKPKTPKN